MRLRPQRNNRTLPPVRSPCTVPDKTPGLRPLTADKIMELTAPAMERFIHPTAGMASGCAATDRLPGGLLWKYT